MVTRLSRDLCKVSIGIAARLREIGISCPAKLELLDQLNPPKLLRPAGADASQWRGKL